MPLQGPPPVPTVAPAEPAAPNPWPTSGTCELCGEGWPAVGMERVPFPYDHDDGRTGIDWRPVCPRQACQVELALLLPDAPSRAVEKQLNFAAHYGSPSINLKAVGGGKMQATLRQIAAAFGSMRSPAFAGTPVSTQIGRWGSRPALHNIPARSRKQPAPCQGMIAGQRHDLVILDDPPLHRQGPYVEHDYHHHPNCNRFAGFACPCRFIVRSDLDPRHANPVSGLRHIVPVLHQAVLTVGGLAPRPRCPGWSPGDGRADIDFAFAFYGGTGRYRGDGVESTGIRIEGENIVWETAPVHGRSSSDHVDGVAERRLLGDDWKLIASSSENPESPSCATSVRSKWSLTPSKQSCHTGHCWAPDAASWGNGPGIAWASVTCRGPPSAYTAPRPAPVWRRSNMHWIRDASSWN